MEQYILEPLSDPIAGVFAIIIGGFFVVSVASSFRKKEGYSAFDRYAPTGLTTIGVIGTFLGIYVGLIEFDVSNIDDSIPSLLAGLKIAFSTSIMGMLASVALKFAQSLKKQNTGKEDVSAGDILQVMTEVRDETKFNRGHMEELLLDLKKAISGDGDSSLVTQIQKLRTSAHDDNQELKKATIDGFDGMKGEFQSFAEKMADNNSKALIDALKDVINDFNAKINEQFGENFKQLNEAVGALLTWQENYKTHVESLVADFDEVRIGIAQTRDAVATIGEQSKAIPETMEDFRKTIQLADDQIEVLKSHLDAVADLRDKAVQAFPVIEENIQKLTTGFTTSISESADLISATMSEQSSVIKSFADQNVILLEETTARHKEATASLEAATIELPKQVDRILVEMQSGMDDAISTYTKEMESSVRSQSDTIQEISAGFRDTLQKSLTDTNELIQKSFAEFDNQMQSEIERTITMMGSHLASLSNKFVEDYTPLTDKLNRIVEMSRRAGE
jgi:hypothetical protein